jgi:hypothetical protein
MKNIEIYHYPNKDAMQESRKKINQFDNYRIQVYRKFYFLQSKFQGINSSWECLIQPKT